ncbi:hypothetical protein GGI1_21028 [Acidithiobacillus sp. GGI-221]|nr:hypothetical protein GGI1_21028 [Acidithiobacillus sp. GGI-221]
MSDFATHDLPKFRNVSIINISPENRNTKKQAKDGSNN